MWVIIFRGKLITKKDDDDDDDDYDDYDDDDISLKSRAGTSNPAYKEPVSIHISVTAERYPKQGLMTSFKKHLINILIVFFFLKNLFLDY